MAYKLYKYCLYFSLLVCFMLLYQAGNAQYNFSKINDWINENLEDLGGRAVLLIFKDGKIVYSHTENDLNRKQKKIGKMIARKTGKNSSEVLKDYDSNTRIPIASCSKWLSAALVMTFIDDGTLKLSDTIGKFLPVMNAHEKGRITIADCLSHLTGIKSGSLKESRELINGAGNMNEAIDKIAAQPMEATPGSAFHYSSIGLQITAAVLEKISGKNFEQLFRERIALPCYMMHTDFGIKPVPLPAGGAFSTAADYLNFLQMILQDGQFNGNKVLSKKSVEAMQQNNISGKKVIYTPAEAGNWGYGFGEWVMDNATNNKRSGGVSSPGLFGSFPWIDNIHQYAAVLFTSNLISKGRNTRYIELKKLVDAAITNN